MNKSDYELFVRRELALTLAEERAKDPEFKIDSLKYKVTGMIMICEIRLGKNHVLVLHAAAGRTPPHCPTPSA